MFIVKLFSGCRIVLVGVLIALLPDFAISQVNVYPVSSAKAGSEKNGVFYSLPRTVFQVALKINKVQKLKGPYSDYANKYLGLPNCITTNSTEYEIEEISISTIAEPDPEKFYFVELGEKASKQGKAIEMYLSQSGMLQNAGDVSGMKNSKVSTVQQEQASAMAEILNPSWFERVDTIIRRISVDTVTIEQKVFRKASSEKTIEQKAKDAADYILKLDENKLNLLSGYQEISYEKASLEYMCDQLDKLKEEYLELFQGMILKSVITENFTFIPKEDESGQTNTLCKFSKMKGVTDNSGSGDPVTIIVESLGRTKTVSEFLKKQKLDEDQTHGFYYCIPEDARVSIKVGGQTKLESTFPVNQLGIITSAPSGDFSSFRLYNDTGSIKTVILE